MTVPIPVVIVPSPPAAPLACHPERSDLTHSPRASFARLP